MANSPDLSIQDGDVFRQEYWTASADIPLDTYVADRQAKPKWVRFISDQDTLSFWLEAGVSHDFWVVLANGDSCLTRVQSGMRSPDQLPKVGEPDTLRFTLTEFQHMIFPARLNGKDSVQLMFHLAAQGLTLIQDSAARFPSVDFNQEDSARSWGGRTASRTSQGNLLELGPFQWDKQMIWENKASGQFSDGKFGLNYFDHHILEFDFSEEYLVVHTRLPDTSSYTRVPLKMRQERVFVPTRLQVGDTVLTHSFLLHLGYGGSLLLNDAFAHAHKVSSFWPVTSEQILTDAYGNEIQVKKATVPHMEVGPFALESVPAGYFDGNLGRQSMSVMGGDMMQRFDMLLDLQQVRLYLKSRG